nr:non-specific lipid transfer protein 1b [Fagopyrum tataricum]
MAFSYTKLACLLMVCMAVAAPEAEAALTCGTVTKNLVPCLPYLKGGTGPSVPCCNGVKALASSANTPADRKIACGCLKQSSGAISGLNLGNAAALPGKCGVSVPYKISPSTDCSKVN